MRRQKKKKQKQKRNEKEKMKEKMKMKSLDWRREKGRKGRKEKQRRKTEAVREEGEGGDLRRRGGWETQRLQGREKRQGWRGKAME